LPIAAPPQSQTEETTMKEKKRLFKDWQDQELIERAIIMLQDIRDNFTTTDPDALLAATTIVSSILDEIDSRIKPTLKVNNVEFLFAVTGAIEKLNRRRLEGKL
jgi:hypothetical protein